MRSRSVSLSCIRSRKSLWRWCKPFRRSAFTNSYTTAHDDAESRTCSEHNTLPRQQREGGGRGTYDNPINTQRLNSKTHAFSIIMDQKNTHPRVERAQRQPLGLCCQQRDLENTKRSIMENERGTHLRIDDQQRMPQNSNPHPQDMDHTLDQ